MVEKKDNKTSFLKFTVITILIFILIALIIYQIKRPMNGILFVILFLIFIVIGISIMFGQRIFKWISSEKPKSDEIILPEPISDDECYEIFEQKIKSERYANQIKTIDEEGSETIGDNVKSDVYTVIAKGRHLDDESKPITYVAIINKHFPHQKRKFLVNPTEAKILKTRNLMASHPSKEPDTEQTVTKNPLLGTETTTLKKVHRKKEDKVKKEEEES